MATRIVAPVEGSIVALDPDIPPAHQRLRLKAEGGGPNLRWRVGGREVGRGDQARWLPWPGRQVVQLTDARGRVIDEVSIEVRGAGVRPAGATAAATRPSAQTGRHSPG